MFIFTGCILDYICFLMLDNIESGFSPAMDPPYKQTQMANTHTPALTLIKMETENEKGGGGGGVIS